MANRRVVIEVPEEVLLAVETDNEGFAWEVCVLAAVKLYELGRLSSGRAAELAGMSRVEFLSALGRYRVFPFEAELAELDRGELARRLCGMGAHLAPGRDAVAELVEERERDDAECSKEPTE